MPEYVAQIGQREFPIFDGSMTWQQNQVGKLDFTVPHHLVGEDDLLFQDVFIWRDGQFLVNGFVAEYYKTTIKNGVLLREINCLEPLGRLMYDYFTKLDAHYQDIQLTVILQNLLTVTGGAWALNDQSTMPDQNIKTTIDLRTKETLWAQLLEAVKATPGNYLRYGKLNSGVQQLNVGAFNTPRDILLSNDNLLKPVTLTRTGDIPIRYLKAFGGKADTKTVTLADALASDPTLASDPNYPIIIDATGYFIRNDTITAGRKVTKYYDVIKTKNNTTPTATEIKQAGMALYRKGLREIQKTEPTITLKASCVLPIIPVPAPCPMRVVSGSQEYIFDHAEGRLRLVEAMPIDLDMVATQITLRFSQTGYLVQDGQRTIHEYFDLDLSESGSFYRNDEALELAEKLVRNDKDDAAGATLQFISSSDVVVNQTGVASNCTTGGIAGRSFVFPLPAIPPGATQVYLTVRPSDPTCNFNLTTTPALPSTNGVACVTGPNGAPWTVSTNITCTGTYYFV